MHQLTVKIHQGRYAVKGKVAQSWRWRMRSRNGRIVAASTEAFHKFSACIHNLYLATGIMVHPDFLDSVHHYRRDTVITVITKFAKWKKPIVGKHPQLPSGMPE